MTCTEIAAGYCEHLMKHVSTSVSKLHCFVEYVVHIFTTGLSVI